MLASSGLVAVGGAGLIEQVELIIRQPGHPDRVVRLREGTTQMGRAEDNDVVLADVGVSRRHARIVLTRDQVRIEDMGSGNGTYFRGARVDSRVLGDGDEVIIDPFVLRFRVKGRGSAVADGGDNEAPARLDVLYGAAMAKSSYPIGAQGLTLGRSETRDVVIPDPACSRHHCTVFLQDGRYVARDMGSANGIFHNGVRVREAVLTDGDRVKVGNTEFRFVMGDSTKVAGSGGAPDWPMREGPSADGWDGRDVSMPVARYDAPPSSFATSSLLPMAFGGAVALLVLMLVVVIGVLILYLVAGPTRPRVAEARPPTWSLRLPPDQPAADVPKLFSEGIASMKAGKNKEALDRFYRSLQQDPGNPSAERLVYMAGEYVLLDALEPALEKAAAQRAEREALQEKLLKQSKLNGSAGARAREQLEAEFAEVPEVRAALGLPPSPLARTHQEKLAEAAELTSKKKPVEAVALYEEVLAATQDPTVRRTAEAGLEVARREVARLVASSWRAGVSAEVDGDIRGARRELNAVVGVDPKNPSARLRLARFPAESP